MTKRLQAGMEKPNYITLIVNQEDSRPSHILILIIVVPDDKPPNGQD
jgi:hypothetical protein